MVSVLVEARGDNAWFLVADTAMQKDDRKPKPAGRRFRRDSDAYLSTLEALLIEQPLLSWKNCALVAP